MKLLSADACAIVAATALGLVACGDDTGTGATTGAGGDDPTSSSSTSSSGQTTTGGQGGDNAGGDDAGGDGGAGGDNAGGDGGAGGEGPSDVCGDGVLSFAEECDDGNTAPADGCDAACVVENGFDCTGQPSVCVSTCGDGVVASDEPCDDGGTSAGDGCDALCGLELGYSCAGEPSVCATTCGDGVQAGLEDCDDGNLDNADGCSDMCTLGTGETCNDPLGIAQATLTNGAYTWTIADGAVTIADGEFACDPNGIGPDVIIVYEKTSADLANGGQLLHVRADSPETATNRYLNLEIRSGGCEPASSASEKCLWYKHDWDAYVDLPAGTYYVFVAQNAPSATITFPEVVVTIEEIDASDAEGEGCFAPYDDTSAIYTPPAASGWPHKWMLPATINSFDMGGRWGAPGSISCDNTKPYGDVHGVDAVIEFNKTSPTSVLFIETANADPLVESSDLNVEVLSGCDPENPATISRHCRANGDIFKMTAPSPAGPVYLWVSTEATGEEFDGASVRVTEIFPGVGETWPTAQPLAASGPISPTSTERYDVPSCIPLTSYVHWYSYTLSNDVLSISANQPHAIGVYDEGGQQVACLPDATSGLSFLGSTGATYFIAIPSPGPITSIQIGDYVYNGVGRTINDMQFEFLTSPTLEMGMAVNANEIFLGNMHRIFAIAKTVGAQASEFGAADGLTDTHLGYDLLFAGGHLFSIDSTPSTTANRLYSVYDGMTWGPTTWDLTPSYPAMSPSNALAWDGSAGFMATLKTSSPTSFYSFSVTSAGSPQFLGSNTSIWYVTGLAADDTYFYVASTGFAGPGVYRIPRANVTTAPLKLATLYVDTNNSNIELDDLNEPDHLYVRDNVGDVHAIGEPDGVAPFHFGPVITLGTAIDYGMTFDRAEGVMYLFETETDAAGRVVRIQ